MKNLLKNTINEVRNTLNSLGGKPIQKTSDLYVARMISFILLLAKDYVETNRASSNLLIRPAIEALFKASAAVKSDENLLRIAWSEKKEKIKMHRILPGTTDAQKEEVIAHINRDFEELKNSIQPDAVMEGRGFNVSEIARLAEMEEFYNSYYRYYCKTTHANFFNVCTGRQEHIDDPTVVICLLRSLKVLKEIGAESPNFRDLVDGLDKIRQGCAG